MKFSVLASGSKGNMTFLKTEYANILIDCGISYQAAMERLEHLCDLTQIDGIFITHEHIDHIKFLPTFIKKTNAVVYINKESLHAIPQAILARMNGARIRYLEDDQEYKLKDITIRTMNLSHDSKKCYGLVVQNHTTRYIHATDTGFFPLQYLELLKTADALMIECNHDVEMLMDSHRSWYLKERILSPTGHMSNLICAQVLRSIQTPKLKFVVLAHLSEDCNTEELAYDTVKSHLHDNNTVKILIAKQHRALPFVDLAGGVHD